MKETKYAICPICGSSCGLVVELENGAIQSIKGDREDPHNRGYVCPKGRSLKYQHTDPDRLLHPVKRSGNDWTEVSWDAAMDDIARRVARIRKKHGRDAVALYAGDGTTHSYETLFSIAAFVLGLGIKNLYTANSMDALPRLFASMMLYGSSGIIPVPDVTRTQYLLVLGSNPVVSNGSVMTAPGFVRHIRGIRKRGGKVVVVDPRRNETAGVADEHLFIRPETDVLFLLAMMNHIFATGRDNPGALRKRIRGRREFKRRVEAFTPERAAVATGIPASEIRRVAEEFADAPGAVCYGRMGTCAQTFGATASALVDTLNIITGNMDRPGGPMFPTPAVDMGSLMGALGMGGKFAENHTRVSGLPDFNGEMPCAALAEEIEAPGGIRALIVVGGNPAVSVPDTAGLTRAFGKLDLLVALDPHINATSCHAHYVLPPAIGLEHEVFPMMSYATAVHNVIKWAPPALDPPPTVRYDSEILGELLVRILAAGAPPAVTQGLLGLGEKFDSRDIIRLLISIGPHGRLSRARDPLTFEKIQDNPHGILLGPLEPRLEKLLGRNGRIQLMHKILREEFNRMEEFARKMENAEPSGDDTLILISRRQLHFFNTSLHNIESLATGREQCTLEIHPGDAEPRGISTGDTVVVATGTGENQVQAEVTDRVMPGTVSLPFGWNGPQPAARQQVLNAHPGMSVNTITRASRIDPVCAMSAFNGTRVKVSRT